MSSFLLITGDPGAGKTLRALQEADTLFREGRPVYWANVRGMKRADWERFDPLKWMDLPDGSVLLIDEVQDFWPQRSPSKEPPESVKRLDKHRHRGFTLIVTTQKPPQMDYMARYFVTRHIHVRNNFGMQNGTQFDMPRIMDVDDKGDLNKAIKTAFVYPKEIYEWYESATQHNVKPRIPLRVLAFPVLLLGVVGLAWGAWSFVSGFGDKVANPITGAPLSGKTTSSGGLGGIVDLGSTFGSSQTSSAAAASTVGDVRAYVPRIAGLPHTAPRYDELTMPVRVPYPAACVVNASSGCKCWTQQATPYNTTDALCRQFVVHGHFLDFEPEPQRGGVSLQQIGHAPPVARPGAVFSASEGVGSAPGFFAAPEPRQHVASRFSGDRAK